MVTFVQLCHEIMCYYGIVIKDIKSSPLTFMIVIKTSEMVSFSNDFLGGDYMVMKICRKCGSLIPYPHTYCTKCQNEYNKDREQQLKESKKKYDANYNKYKRNKEHTKFYNSDEWKLLKEKYLQDQQYRCEKCEELHKLNRKHKRRVAVEVHHKKWLSTPDGWERRLDYTNLMALCHAHHDEMHGRFQKKKKQSI